MSQEVNLLQKQLLEREKMIQLLSPNDYQEMASQLVLAKEEMKEFHRELEVKMKIIEEMGRNNRELLEVNKILQKRLRSQ